MSIWPRAMKLMFGYCCMCQRKIHDYLATGHACHVWLLIAGVRGKRKKKKKKKVMFILARAHEFNWLLIACGSENFMIGLVRGHHVYHVWL